VFADFSYLDIVEPFAKFQKALKLTTTYGNRLTDLINPSTGRLHANYNLSGARTGRLSCSNPNLQQAPKDAEFRSCFIPKPGNVFIRADYNQIEIRVAAELSRDETMLTAYRQGVDIHSVMAAKVTGKRIEDVTKEDRQLAKACNFGFMFGLGAKGFVHYARKLYGKEVTADDAKEAVNSFRTLYAGYRDWQLSQNDSCANSMSVRTPCGKLRRLNTENCYGGSMNTPVQGGAAECMLHALVFLYHTFLEHPDLEAKLVNCVHDEIVVECPKSKADEVSFAVNSCMVEGFLAVFPEGITNHLVACGIGPTWAEAK
jgi:DNA polymerase I-like protein with 3'-5' exonuclease and polymerase domains